MSAILMGMVYAPDKKQIEDAKREIRSRWSEKTRMKRATAGGLPQEWTVPVVSVSFLPDEVRGWISSVNKESEDGASGE